MSEIRRNRPQAAAGNATGRRDVSHRCGAIPPGQLRRAGRARGSATVELLVVVPFVLMLLAAVWDVRQFIAFRTELAREMFVLAEAVADDPGGASPLESAMRSAQQRLEGRSTSGVVQAAVVVRGTGRASGGACQADEWCSPMVELAWPDGAANPAGTWSRGEDNPCVAVSANAFPARGAHFVERQAVLPDEGTTAGGGEAAESAWISRNIAAEEWWVVVDTCIEPEPGLFIGRLVNLAGDMLDTPYLWHRRAAWRSIHDRVDCDWCAAAEPDTDQTTNEG